MLKNYLKIAYRQLKRRPGYTAINVIGLAVGMACCLLLLLYVRGELSYDRFHEKAERIYRVNLKPMPERGVNRPIAITPNIVAPLLARELSAVEKGVRLRKSGGVVRRERRAFREDDFFYADSTFFDIFDFTFKAGSPATALERPHAVVLTETAARRYFGDENPMGQTLTLNSETEFEVTGIIEDVPPNSHLQFSFVASWSTLTGWQKNDLRWDSANFFTYVLLREGTDAGALQQRIDRLVAERRAAGDEPRALSLMPLTDLHLYADLAYALDPTGDIRYVWIFGALAVMVLLTACINYMNLATARSAQRGQEIGMRKALGATRPQLTRQLYGETALLVGVALAAAVGLARLGLPLLDTLSGGSHALSDLPLSLLIGTLVGTGLLVSLVAGSYPALLLSSFQPARVLKGTFQAGRGGARFRKALVIFQFAVAVFLIASTFVIRDQLGFLQKKNLGFDKEQVAVLPLDDPATRTTLEAAFSQHPGITSLSAVNQYPSALGWTGQAAAEGVPEAQQPLMKGFITDTDIVETLGLEVVAGRGFPATLPHPDSTAGGYRYLLNETAVQRLGWTPREAIGKRFEMLGPRPGRVIGVVKDFHFASLRQSIEPMAIWYHPDRAQHLLVRIAPGQTEEALTYMERQWASVVGQQPFQYRFLDDAFDALYRNDQRVGQVFGAFALLAVLVACLGLFGLAAFAAERRRKEIAVRKTFGASMRQIVALLSKDFLKLVALGALIATPLAWLAVRRWLEGFAYRIELGPLVFLAAGALALVVALAATGAQALRAARTNPAEALRDE